MNALVALPLVASPAVASYGSSPNADAELIALGREIERAFIEIRPLQKQIARMVPVVEAELNRRPKPSTVLAAIRLRNEVWDDLGFTPTSDQVDEVYARADEASTKIMEILPTTIVGLAIKARSVAFQTNHLWEQPFDDLDWDEKHYRSMIEATCAMAGFPAPDQTMTIAAYDALVSRNDVVPACATLADRAA